MKTTGVQSLRRELDQKAIEIANMAFLVETLQQEKAALETALKEFGWTLPAGSVAAYHNWYPAFVEQRARAEQAERELDVFRNAGIVEIAVRNQSVRDYIDHWEGRVAQAEATTRRLREALEAARGIVSHLYAMSVDDGVEQRAVLACIDLALADTPEGEK